MLPTKEALILWKSSPRFSIILALSDVSNSNLFGSNSPEASKKGVRRAYFDNCMGLSSRGRMLSLDGSRIKEQAY